MDTSRENAVRERNKAANKQGEAQNCMKKEKMCNLNFKLLNAPPKGNRETSLEVGKKQLSIIISPLEMWNIGL